MDHARRPHAEDEDESELAGVCVDILRGASKLLARRKVEVVSLLPERGPTVVGALKQLMADLTEVLDTAMATTSEQQQQQQQHGIEEGEGMAIAAQTEARPASPVMGTRVKRAKGQQAAQAGGAWRQQQGGAAAPSSSMAIALGVPEVVEHVMSFAKEEDLLLQLNRVCRMWRRVSESERLSVPVVERYMPSALLGGGDSLHARLGGSARRCLTVQNAWSRPGSCMCFLPSAKDFSVRLEILNGDRPLFAARGRVKFSPVRSAPLGRLFMTFSAGQGGDKTLTAASFTQEADVNAVFASGTLWSRCWVMDRRTGLTACLYQDKFEHQGPAPNPGGDGEVTYTTSHTPVTSMTYAGPPLYIQMQITIRIGQGQQGAAPLDPRDKPWRFQSSSVTLVGQPGIYGERFIRTRLAEEEVAVRQSMTK